MAVLPFAPREARASASPRRTACAVTSQRAGLSPREHERAAGAPIARPRLMDPTASLLARVREGRSTVVVSATGEAPDMPNGTVLLRVDARGARDLGILERAAQRLEELSEGPSARLRLVRAASTLRDRLLREETGAPAETRFVEAANRLAGTARGRAALAFEGLEAAGPIAIEGLARLAGPHSRLHLPLVLVCAASPSGELARLAEALGPGGLVVVAAAPPSSSPAAEDLEEDEPSPEIEAEARAETEAALAVLPREVVRVLRASAVVGCRSEAHLVGALLGVTLEEVLEGLQVAADAGVPIRDGEDGTFTMPPWLAHALAASVLPSLRMRWHERLAELLAAEGDAETVPPDSLRAAEHLASAGRSTEALEHRLDAAATETRRGEPLRAGELLDAASHEIADLAASPVRTRLLARAALERARLRWLGVGLEPSLSLRGALEVALAARGLLVAETGADGVADAASIVAGIAYDLGDPDVMAQAETTLATSARGLLARGARMEAARLLNDQAALLLRRGEIAASRDALLDALRIFAARCEEAPSDERATVDLADTHHLLARVALHEPSRDDLEPALEHARSAEDAYASLGFRRDVARVWETMGRLEARRGHLARARDRFSAALQVEDASADLTGIARATAALAEVLAAAGDPAEAVELLASSIELNREKGSPIGLAFDARALERVTRTLEGRGEIEADVRARLARTADRLDEATRELTAGELALPLSFDPRPSPAGHVAQSSSAE